VKKAYADELVALGFMLLCFYFLYLTRGFSEISARFPRVVLVAIIVLCVLFVLLERIKAFFASKRLDHPAKRKLKKNAFTQEHVMVLGAIALYLIMTTRLGYYLASILYLIFTTFYLGFRQRRILLGLAFGLTLFVFLFFQLLLGLRLPSGVLF